MTPRSLLGRLAAAACLAASALTVCAKPEKWTFVDGKPFKGEPEGIYGPYALFRTGSAKSIRIPLGKLVEAERAPFHAALAGKKPRGASWAQATGELTRELAARTCTVADKKLVKADLSARPEPEFLLLFFGSHNNGETWSLNPKVRESYDRLRAAGHGPAVFEAVFYGVGHGSGEHQRIAGEAQMPWLIMAYGEQKAALTLKQIVPGDSPRITLANRQGLPLYSSESRSEADCIKTLAAIERFLAAQDPDAAPTFPDRLAFWRSVQLATHQTTSAPPLLIGLGIPAQKLRDGGVPAFEARIRVGADGEVFGVDIPGNALDAELRSGIASALARSAFVPAIESGVWMSGDYVWRFEP